MPKVLSALALLVLIFFYSCQVEELSEETNSENKKTELPINIKTLSYGELGEKFKHLEQKQGLNKFKKAKEFKTTSSADGSIVIYTESVKEITQGDYTSYTMYITTPNSTEDVFYNLTVEEQNGKTGAFITRYVPTEDWVMGESSFTGEVSTQRSSFTQAFEDNPDDGTTNPGNISDTGGGSTIYPTDCDGYVRTTTVVNDILCGCGDSWQDYLNGECTGCIYRLPRYPSITTSTYYECVPYADPSGGNTTGGTGDSSGSSGGTSPESPTGGSLTTPIYADGETTDYASVRQASFNIFLGDNNQSQWFNSQPLATQNNITGYLESTVGNTTDVNYSQEALDFVGEFITQSISTGLILDLNLSIKSPAFIDMSSVSGNTPEEVKFREVYSSLASSPMFKNLFINLFGVSPLFGVKFTIENIPQTANGYIAGSCHIVNNGSLNPFNTIRIDRNFLLSKSKVDIAQTIIHEAMHAFLNIKLRNPNIGIPISTLNNMDIQDCINTYYNGFSGNQTQHNFFVNYMVPTLAQILIEIKDSIITPQQANQLENPTNGAAFIYQPLTNPPTFQISTTQIQWNWNNFFNYFSYSGLQNCTAYPYTTPLNQGHIFNNNEDYYNYYYNFAFNIIFNP